MIELGSKALFFINLIIHAVAKCGGDYADSVC